MRETNIFEYYAFGYNYRILRSYQSVDKVHGDENSLVGRLERFFAYLEELGLRVTMRAATNLHDTLEEVRRLDKDADVDEVLAKRVRAAVDKLDVTLDAELQLAVAYIITPKRFGVDQLLKAPESLLGDGVHASLPVLSQYDFTEGTRCIAYECPTAAAFHLMRCVEGVLRDYYCAIVMRGRVKRLMWFDMLKHLNERRDAPPQALIDNLNSVRANFRNPTQHPDARYDMDEAQDLLAVAIDAINRMCRDLRQRS